MIKPAFHTSHDALELQYQDQILFRYIYNRSWGEEEIFLSPKPYFHPLKTLAGNEVSLFRPYDHPWHTGLAMTMAQLSGENFWGGGTYTREAQNYVQLANNGRIQHLAWLEKSDEEAHVASELLHWKTQAGATWMEEQRHIGVSEVNAEEGYWSLDLAFHLVNVSAQPLVFGSPTTEGRPLAGYGSLFWRGPRSFLGGQIIGADGLEGPEMLGQSSPWLAFTGWHDGSLQQSTLLFLDQPGNPRYPNKWFVRNDPYACVSFSFMFDEYYTLPPAAALDLSYRIVIINGAWSRDRIERYRAQRP
ncbi:MAG TPA: PmoA family protein [Ktedonobacteraceae bacterium]|nr:PmoA family protein [Ktedonobacteraceae bacterium]